MKCKNCFYLFVSFLFLGMILSKGGFAFLSQTDQGLFEMANESYKTGNYKKAIEYYNALTTNYPDEPAFYYNLGNSYFRVKELGKAILAYEKARLRAPRHSDILRNLEYTHKLLEYKIEDKRNWYLKTGDDVLNFFREEEINFVLFAIVFLFLASWIYSLYFRAARPWGWFRKGLTFLFVLGVVLSAAKNVEKHVMRDAIITVKEAEVRYGPSVEDQIAFRLGEGLKIYVIDSRQAWSRVLVINGESGWIKNSQISLVN